MQYVNHFYIKHALIVLISKLSPPSLLNYGYLEIFYSLLNGTPDSDILRGQHTSVQLRFLLFENIMKLLKIHIKERKQKMFN